MNDLNPSIQSNVCASKEFCYLSNAPTLGLMSATYGENAPKSWLIPQLIDLSEFCGCRDKLSQYQLETLAVIISSEFYYLKITELMLFFFRFKCGNYGVFYGAVDPMRITEALRVFVEERKKFLDKKEEADKAREREERQKEVMTYQEWCERNGKQPKEYKIGVKDVNKVLNEKEKLKDERLFEEAMCIVDNKLGLDNEHLLIMEDMFKKKTNVSASDFVRGKRS